MQLKNGILFVPGYSLYGNGNGNGGGGGGGGQIFVSVVFFFSGEGGRRV